MRFNDSKSIVEYSNDMNDIYGNIEKYNPNKKRKKLIVYGDAITDVLSNKNLNKIVTELLIRGRKLNGSLVSNTQSFLLFQKILD